MRRTYSYQYGDNYFILDGGSLIIYHRGTRVVTIGPPGVKAFENFLNEGKAAAELDKRNYG